MVNSRQIIFIFQVFIQFSLIGRRLSASSICNYTISEGVPGNIVIPVLNSSSILPGEKYEFKLSKPNQYFKIERETNWLRSKGVIDREELCETLDSCKCDGLCYIEFEIMKQRIPSSGPPRFLPTRICVKDVNDNSPEMSPRYDIKLNEDSRVGKMVTLPLARDADSLKNSVKSYSIMCPRDTLTLHYRLKSVNSTIQNDQVWVTLNKPLDREKSSHFQCDVSASDGKHEAKMTLYVEILDVNDNPPQWMTSNFNVTIPENSHSQTVIFTLKANDLDLKYGQIRYELGSQVKRNIRDFFRVKPHSGEVILNTPIDYEVKKNRLLYIPVVAKDNGEPIPKSATATLIVAISDVNDNKPNIKPNRNSIEIVENSLPKYLDYITVSDADAGENGKVSCSLENERERFKLNKSDSEGIYLLHSQVAFDHEVQRGIEFNIICKDNGQPSLDNRKKIYIRIKDVNDSPPQFIRRQFRANVTEGIPNGSALLTALATDNDENPQLEYSLDPNANYVYIDKKKGEIYSKKQFDREKPLNYNYTFYVAVTDGGPKNHSDLAWVTLIIHDMNDNSPTFEKTYRIKVPENTTVNSVIGRVNATDPDEGNNGRVEFRSADYVLPFRVQTDGRIILRRALNRETVASYELTVIATDQGKPIAMSSTTTVVILVTDVNDNPPQFLKHEYIKNVTCHQHYVAMDIRADDADETPNNIIYYKLLRVFPESRTGKPKFMVAMKTGEISMEPPENCNFGRTWRLTIRAYDPSDLSKRDDTRVTVNLLPSPSSPGGGVLGGRGGPGSRRRNGKDAYGGLRSDANLFVVVALVCVSVLLAVLMLSLILYLKRRQERDRGYEKGTPLSKKSAQAQAPNSCPLPRKQFSEMRPPDGCLYLEEDSGLQIRHPEEGHCLEERSPGDNMMCTSLSADDILFSADCQGTGSRTIGWKESDGRMALRIDGTNIWSQMGEGGTLQKGGRCLVDPQHSRDTYHTYQTMSSVEQPSLYTDLPPSLVSGPGGPPGGVEMNQPPSSAATLKMVSMGQGRGIDHQSGKRGAKADVKQPYFTISFV